MAAIDTGAKFYNFQQFEDAFEKWKSENFHPFRVASSETLRMPDGSANEIFKYRYIVYHCAHYGAPRMRGAGKRPNQNYLPCGCRAMLRVNFSWSENVLRVTTLNPEHSGHDVSAETYSRFTTKVRRVGGSNTPDSVKSNCSSSSGLSRKSPYPLLKKEEQMSPVLAKPLPALANYAVNNNLESPLGLLLSAGQKENAWSLSNSEKTWNLANSLAFAGYGLFGPPQSLPLDLTDKRTDEERFQEMHIILQGVTDSLMSCKGHEFDSKLRQLRNIYKSWSLYKKN